MNYKIYYPNTKLAKAYKSALDEYLKRLSRYCKISTHPIKNEQELIKKLNTNTYTIKINTTSESLDSVSFANKLDQLGTYGTSEIAFIIDLDYEANEELTLSYYPFNNELILITLLEQIYRAYRILNNEPYHK